MLQIQRFQTPQQFFSIVKKNTWTLSEFPLFRTLHMYFFSGPSYLPGIRWFKNCPPLRLVHKVEPVSVAWIVFLMILTHGSIGGFGLKGLVVGIPGIPLLNPGIPLLKSWVNWWLIGLIPGRSPCERDWKGSLECQIHQSTISWHDSKFWREYQGNCLGRMLVSI